jgi:hypothetical protein
MVQYSLICAATARPRLGARPPHSIGTVPSFLCLGPGLAFKFQVHSPPPESAAAPVQESTGPGAAAQQNSLFCCQRTRGPGDVAWTRRRLWGSPGLPSRPQELRPMITGGRSRPYPLGRTLTARGRLPAAAESPCLKGSLTNRAPKRPHSNTWTAASRNCRHLNLSHNRCQAPVQRRQGWIHHERLLTVHHDQS